VLEVEEEMESWKESGARDGGSELPAEGEEEMIDYDQEDLDSDEMLDFESAESGSSDVDSYDGAQSDGRKGERIGGVSVAIAPKLDDNRKLDDPRKKSLVQQKKAREHRAAGASDGGKKD